MSVQFSQQKLNLPRVMMQGNEGDECVCAARVRGRERGTSGRGNGEMVRKDSQEESELDFCSVTSGE